MVSTSLSLPKHCLDFAFQKQSSKRVLSKRCSENMHIYRRIPMSKCDFNKVEISTLLKSHFGMGVLLKNCCIFSGKLFLRTPSDGHHLEDMEHYTFFMFLWESFCKKIIHKNPNLKKMSRKSPTSNAWPQFSKTLIFPRVC